MNEYLFIILLVFGLTFLLFILIWLLFIIITKISFKKLDVYLKRRHVLSIDFLPLIYDSFLHHQSALIRINDIIYTCSVIIANLSNLFEMVMPTACSKIRKYA